MHAKPLDETPWNRIRRRRWLPACLDRSIWRKTAVGFAEATWWSEGSARVEPACLTLRRLPDAATYAAMLGAENKVSDVAPDAFRHGERKWESPP